METRDGTRIERCGMAFEFRSGLGWIPASSGTFEDQRPRFASPEACEEWAAAIASDQD